MTLIISLTLSKIASPQVSTTTDKIIIDSWTKLGTADHYWESGVHVTNIKKGAHFKLDH
jgi:hypothetical protein